MILKLVILFIIFFVFLIYILFFKEYFKVRRVYMHLTKFLYARDALALKLIPETKNKKLAKKVVMLIDERKENFKTSYNNSILSDVKLNSELRKFYEYLNSVEKNEVTNSVLKKILTLEKDLKNIRKEYNIAVEKYNRNLLKHKFVCLKLIRMKPLDTYNIKHT